MINLTVTLPKRMRALQKDERGYPIPFVVLRDKNNNPHFAVNDSMRQRRALYEKRCPICGTRLDRLLWFVGGPLSAFHEHGAYMDTALHHECMTYALQVCPYLSMPKYLSDTAHTNVLTKLAGKLDQQILVDNTQIPERPSLFVAVSSYSQTILNDDLSLPARVRPVRPYVAVEFWQHGRRLAEETALKLLKKELR